MSYWPFSPPSVTRSQRHTIDQVLLDRDIMPPRITTDQLRLCFCGNCILVPDRKPISEAEILAHKLSLARTVVLPGTTLEEPPLDTPTAGTSTQSVHFPAIASRHVPMDASADSALRGRRLKRPRVQSQSDDGDTLERRSTQPEDVTMDSPPRESPLLGVNLVPGLHTESNPREQHHSNNGPLNIMAKVNIDVDRLLKHVPPPLDDTLDIDSLPSFDIPYSSIEDIESLCLVPGEACVSASRHILGKITRQTNVVQDEKQRTIQRLEVVEERLRQWRVIIPSEGPVHYPCRKFSLD